MHYLSFLVLLCLSAFSVSPRSAVAQPDDRNVFASGAKTKELCVVIAAEIKAGLTREVVHDALEAGNNVCPVVYCALENGGPLNLILAGVKDAGMSSDTVKRCSSATCSQVYSLAETDETCGVIRKELEKGEDPRKVVREWIRKGSSICFVTQCAVSAGADLGLILAGARDSGGTPDVLARCALDACADPVQIARILEEAGLGYSFPEEPDQDIRAVGGIENGTKFLSPSSF